ncbi:hypothetical protein NP233_g13058 [Leucocoprinus birnbaumii]|uniref:Uncharacterized protein n=1 Tax=Leucocoprinus birnbaumii TaxID=56174 RepID=A0AAD5VDK2_9AGAR|nr:hypothetical protein NP233_g13058 [Leucocoprinus birnbaumii]
MGEPLRSRLAVVVAVVMVVDEELEPGVEGGVPDLDGPGVGRPRVEVEPVEFIELVLPSTPAPALPAPLSFAPASTVELLAAVDSSFFEKAPQKRNLHL